MMGEHEPRDILLGTTAEGYKVVVRFYLQWQGGEGFNTVEHQPAGRHLRLSITGDVIDPKRRGEARYISGGQIVDSLAEVVKFAQGWDRRSVDELAALWRRWHLNDMRAGCAHVEPVYEIDRYGQRVPSLDHTPACALTGYRYGHAWLVEELPEEVVAYVKSLN